MNRITVITEDASINAQARSYAEYRVFAALSRHAQRFRRTRVVLQHLDDRTTCDKVACAVTVALAPSGCVKVRARGPHVYAAINRAIERLDACLGRRACRHSPPRRLP